MDLIHLCAEYLRSINPIAQRIAEDLENVQNARKDEWVDLDEKGRQQIVDDSLIDEQLVSRYQEEAPEEDELPPLSGFSWFTKSQLDLFTLIDVKPQIIKSPLKKTDVLSPLKKDKDTVDNKEMSIVNRIKMKVMKSPTPDDNRHDMKYSKTLPKPKMPPPPPPPKRLSNSENSALLSCGISQDDIPKTGFDFLDNW